MFQRGLHRQAPKSGRTAGIILRGLSAVALCASGALVTGLAATATPAGAANPSPLLYEVDYGGNAVNVFSTAANGDVAPTRSVTANGSSLSMPQGAAFGSARQPLGGETVRRAEHRRVHVGRARSRR